jgi:alkylation response protein AidB-like acyl-CoA dehydrogenase
MNAPIKKPKAQFAWDDPLLLDQQLTEEERMVRDAARDYCQDKLAPRVLESFRNESTDPEIIREMGQLGLMGIEVPHEYGGAGMDPVAYALAMIEIAAADCAHSTIMSVNNSLYCNGILKYGTEDQKQKYVRAIASGEAIGAYALTEPQSGSDASASHRRRSAFRARRTRRASRGRASARRSAIRSDRSR